MADQDLLDVVDEGGNVIDTLSRKEVHVRGLLHKEVHIWLITPKSELIFQHRSSSKDTYPDLLDASIGGHVDAGMGWLDSAIKEAKEEAGIECSEKDLQFVEQKHINVYDPETKMTNNCLRNIYALLYIGDIDELKIEDGEATHFELWPITKLFNIKPEEAVRFIPNLLDEEHLQLYRKIESITVRG